MTGLERAGYLAHARTAGFARRVQAARACIAWTLEQCRRPYVAFSAGKDSSALLFLVREAAPEIQARFLRSGETTQLHRNVDAVLAWWAGQGARVETILVDRVWAPEWLEATFDEQRRAGRGDLERLLIRPEDDGLFLGLRRDESTRRRIALARREQTPLGRLPVRTIQPLGRPLLRAAPLADWTTQDVGALIALHGLPLLDAYAAEGLETRTTARLTGTAVGREALARLRARDPRGWAELVARFPELGRRT